MSKKNASKLTSGTPKPTSQEGNRPGTTTAKAFAPDCIALRSGQFATVSDILSFWDNEAAMEGKTTYVLDDRTFEEIYSELKKSWSDIPNMGIIEGVLKEFSRDSGLTNILRSRSGVYTYTGTKNPAWQVW